VGQPQTVEYAEKTTLRVLDGIAWGFTLSKMLEVVADCDDMWQLNLELLPPILIDIKQVLKERTSSSIKGKVENKLINRKFLVALIDNKFS